MLIKILKVSILLMFSCQSLQLFASEYVKLTQFSTDDGLTQNTIISIIEDRQGFLWIATDQGINRYDGYQFEPVPSPKNILEDGSIQFLWEDSQGFIWMSTSSNKNFYLDKNNNSLTEVILTVPDKQNDENPLIYNAAEDLEGNVWFSSYEELFFYDRKKRSTTFHISLKPLFDGETNQDYIRDLLIVNSYLFAATTDGLYIFEIENGHPKLVDQLLSDDPINDKNDTKALLDTKNGKILIGAVEGLYEISIDDIKKEDQQIPVKQLVTSLNIWQMIHYDNNYLLATNEGLYSLNKQNELEHILKFSDHILDTTDDDIVSITKDKEGVLWMGSRNDGFFKWHPQNLVKQHYWTKSDDDNKISNDIIYDTHLDENNNVWIATQNGLNKITGDGKVIDRLIVNPDEKASVSSSTIYSIAENKNNLWLNTHAGVRVINKNSNVMVDMLFPKTKNNIFNTPASQLYFLSDSKLALVMYDAVYIYDLIENKVRIVESTVNGEQDEKWIGGFFDTTTDRQNSYFVAGTNKLYELSIETGTLTDVHRLDKSKDLNTYPADIQRVGNNLWITYPADGLYVLDGSSGEEIKFISEEDMSANTLMDMFEDNLGNIWVISNDGLFRINKNTYSIRKFDRSDGIVANEFNGDTSQELPDGNVFLGSMKGVLNFDPNVRSKQTIKPIVPVITDISLLSSKMKNSFSETNNIILKHDDFGLEIKFSALLLSKPKQVKYYYWLVGETKIEKTLINRNHLLFPKFATGETTLYISAVDYRTGFESKPIKMQIFTEPMPLLSVTAKIVYFSIISFVVSFYYWQSQVTRQRKEAIFKQVKQSEERLKLALKGGNSGLWDWLAKDDSIFEPRMPYKNSDNDYIGFEERNSYIHPKDKSLFIKNWNNFIAEKNSTFDFTYRMKNSTGNWEWYRDIAMVSEFGKNNEAIRVTGTYTNITEKQQSVEQVKLYSKAFENTLDIILILNNAREIIASNNSLSEITAFELDEILGKKLKTILKNIERGDIATDVFDEIDNNNHWKGEALLTKKGGSDIFTLVNATQFYDTDQNQHYVFSISDISKQKQAETDLKQLANYDPLTGLPNRALLIDRIKQAIYQCKREGSQLALFFIDLDRFKQINDTLGHDAGDKLLKHYADTLKALCRAGDTVARLGGDEFVILLENSTSVSNLNRLLREIISLVNKPIYVNKKDISVTASIGVSICPQDSDDVLELLRHADIAMYHAKKNGKNQFSFFEKKMNELATRRLELESEIRAAVDNKEFSLVYQPQYDVRSGLLKGVEALTRWKNLSGMIIPPSIFIPIAEELGLIKTMTENLLPKALETLAKWNNSGKKLKLAFNLSATHIYDTDLKNLIANLTDRYEQDIQLLEFELTESTLMKEDDKATETFDMLSGHGIDLALDDFGTGYSSLKYLTTLPLNKLKIDKSFVSKIGTSKNNDTIIRAIISLGKSLGLSIVAEGVETEEQFDFIKAEQVDFVQGFLFSKPVEDKEIQKIRNINIYSNRS